MRFKEYVKENEGTGIEKYPVLWNFMQHLVSGSHVPEDFSGDASSNLKEEARSIEDIKKDGVEAQPTGNVFHHLKEGFAKAFPEGEDEKTTKKKAIEARKIFRKFMTERGGTCGEK